MYHPMPGERVRILYRIPGVHRKQREIVGTVLGGSGHPGFHIDQRPEHGTAFIHEDWIDLIERASQQGVA